LEISVNRLIENGYSKSELADSFNSKKQELILLPTEKCNFRCSYCYEDFKIGSMPTWLVNSIKEFISNRVKNIDFLSLSWFGGEPLLAKKKCLEIIKHSYLECENTNTEIAGSFTTNGYLLTQDLVEELAKYNHASFQITLDGYGENHNMTRKLANGRGSFKTVWGNIVNLKKSSLNFYIKLRLHITNNNYLSMKEMIFKLNEVIGDDPRFSIQFHNIANLGGPNTNEIKTLENKEYLKILKEFKSLLNLRSGSEVESRNNKGICYAAKPNSLLVRADGRIGKCTVLLDDPRNELGKFLPGGEIEINNTKLQPWMYGFQNPINDILSCPAVGGLKQHENSLAVNIL